MHRNRRNICIKTPIRRKHTLLARLDHVRIKIALSLACIIRHTVKRLHIFGRHKRLKTGRAGKIIAAIVEIARTVMEGFRLYAVKILHHIRQAVSDIILVVIEIYIVIQRIIADNRKIFGYIGFFARMEISHYYGAVVKFVKIGIQLAQDILAYLISAGKHLFILHKREPFKAFAQNGNDVVAACPSEAFGRTADLGIYKVVHFI